MIVNTFFGLGLMLATVVISTSCYDVLPIWGYECRGTKCIKTAFKDARQGQSLIKCKMLCGNDIGTLWPKPTGIVRIGRDVATIDYKKIKYMFPITDKTEKLWDLVKIRFRMHVESKIQRTDLGLIVPENTPLIIKVTLNQSPNEANELPSLTYETDEGYSLHTIKGPKSVTAEITAKTFFGARHGLETLLQLIIFDDIQGKFQVMVDADIEDAPVYKHRGVQLDTSRNYFSLKSIKRTIDGMAMSKMNMFHWHMIDSNSFPLVLKSHPDFTNLGAYSPRKVYTADDIRDVVEYARVRGVRVIPEFDGPAHTGEGWQNTNLTVCFNTQPWKDYCFQPPCGQLDPTADAVYDILEDIYREIFDAFEPNIFHMGGDTVSVNCWNSSASIRNWMRSKGWGIEWNDFMKLWGQYQIRSLDKVDKVSKEKKIPVIVWAGSLTEAPHLDNYFDSSRYIIQTSQSEADWKTKQYIERGFRLISSNYDLFISSQAANWNGAGLDGWRKYYENRPDRVFGGPSKLILGSETTVWAEQVDEFSLDTLLWPKASALAERLWSNPDNNWAKAESRFLVHRDLLTANRIRAEALEPEWCVQNPNECLKEVYN